MINGSLENFIEYHIEDIDDKRYSTVLYRAQEELSDSTMSDLIQILHKIDPSFDEYVFRYITNCIKSQIDFFQKYSNKNNTSWSRLISILDSIGDFTYILPYDQLVQYIKDNEPSIKLIPLDKKYSSDPDSNNQEYDLGWFDKEAYDKFHED